MLDIVEFTRIYLAVFFSLVALFYTARIILMKRDMSNELIFPGAQYCKTWWNHLAFRVFRILIWLVCVFRFIDPTLDSYIGTIAWLEQPVVIGLGLFLLTMGFISTIIIHFRLGNEWRSGIDPNGPKTLITSGFYQYSRNPMFISVAIAQLGFLLALPSVFSLLCLCIGIYTLNSQAKSEESHLLALFSNEYSEYCANVRRWI